MSRQTPISIPTTATSETSAARLELISNTTSSSSSSNININIRPKNQNSWKKPDDVDCTSSGVLTIPTRVKYAQLGVYIFMIIAIIYYNIIQVENAGMMMMNKKMPEWHPSAHH